jgi:hypothetical protein
MRMSTITNEDRHLTKISAVIGEALEAGGFGNLRKRGPEKVGDHSQYFVPRDERSLVDRKIPTDDNPRRVAELQEEISNLETALATGPGQDSEAIREKITNARALLSVLTAVPQLATGPFGPR